MSGLSKREKVAFLSERSGLTFIMERLPTTPCLIVLNYHRIGEAKECEFDPGVYSATQEELHNQISYLKKHIHIATLDESIRFIEGGRGHCNHPMALITFDDGYLDNYELAFPVLKGLAVQGTFFLPTSYIGSEKIAWWDIIAYAMKNTKKKQIDLNCQYADKIDMSKGWGQALSLALKAYKSPQTKDADKFLDDLLKESEISLDHEKFDRQFMNWSEAKLMAGGGMAIGSHTHSHKVLASLPFKEQVQELVTSREIIHKKVGIEVDTLAYPVGLKTAFSNETQRAVKESGYRAAFSFYGGINVPGKSTTTNVLRISLESKLSMARLRFQTSFARISGIWW